MARPTGFTINRPAWDHLKTTTGLTCTDIAEQADLTPSAIKNIATGIRGASPQVAYRIARVLGVQPAVLFPDFGRGDVLTLDEVATELRMCSETARRLVATGTIRKVPYAGRRILVTRDELARFTREGARS